MSLRLMSSFGRAGLAVFVVSSLSCGGTEPVVPALTTITVALSLPTIQVAQTASATVNGVDQNGASIAVGAVAWSTGSASIASVTAAGVVTGVAPGQTMVIASAGGKQGQQSITVIAVPVASVTVSPSAPSIAVGGTQQLTAATLDANGATLTGRTIIWTTSDATKATVISSTGVVTAVAVGIATITATSEGKSGTSAVTITPPPVATVTVTPSAPSVFVGSIQQLTAVTLDATGAALTGRTITWTTSDPSRATVSSTGLVTGVAVGAATITATSEGKTGSVAATLIATPAAIILTGIHDPTTFVSHCPTTDPAYATIRQDFELRSDGPLSTVAITCTEPYTTTPIDQLTDELILMQAFRMIYYMSQGSAGKLPWTSLSLYEWMKTQVAGVNFHAAAGYSACCEIIGGKKYIIISRRNASQRDFDRDWNFMSSWIPLLAHETRHAAGFSHVTGCPAFPLPTDPPGCDATYDLSNLGSYGVQYWIFAGLATGLINAGIGCTPPATAQSYASWAARSANLYLTQFVTNAPPSVTETIPYGGPCYPP